MAGRAPDPIVWPQCYDEPEHAEKKAALAEQTQNPLMFRILRAFINLVVGVIELLLTFRFIFEFLVVNTGRPFVAWLNGATAPLVAPFAKILPNSKFSGFVVDFATVAAIIVYALGGYLLLMLFPVSRTVVLVDETAPIV
jgi:Fe2+ transport system protein B